jgi:hypothetical protein
MITLCFSNPLIKKLQTLLRVAYQANDLRWYRIVQGLLGLGEGRGVGEIATLLNVSKRIPYNWLKAFLMKYLIQYNYDLIVRIWYRRTRL